MRVNADAHTKQATANDCRITRVGRFLRASHLDELPQLLNIFLGDMSLIGPRPHMLFHTRYYAEKIPFYHLRHEATPGMTGMAQINGFIGEITNERELRKRIHWDIYYLKHRSIGLDLYILFQTFLHAVRRVFPFGKREEVSASGEACKVLGSFLSAFSARIISPKDHSCASAATLLAMRRNCVSSPLAEKTWFT